MYTDFNGAPSQKQNIILFAANNSRCCECHVAPTNILQHAVHADEYVLMYVQHRLVGATKTENFHRTFAVWNSRGCKLVARTSPC
jgi:hypothetical protein